MQEINEDQLVIGQILEVTEAIPEVGVGRIAFGDSTWQASADDGGAISVGEKVKVVKRENITWLVERA